MADIQRQPEQSKGSFAVSGLVDCAKCGHSNAQGIRYCENCGASLAGIAPSEKALEASSGEKPNLFHRLFGRK